VPTWWTVERRDAVAVATFTRPPRNFMSFAAMTELEGVLDELADDDGTALVVLTGGVPGYFVAHADLDDLQRLGRGDPVDGDPGSWGRALARCESMPQPVVAAIAGQAWGGGCELALACTLRVVSASAHLAQPEVNVGIIPGAGGTQRLPRLVGPARGAELVLSGRVVGAEEALAMGLVNAVLPDDGFLDHVLGWVEPIAAKPRAALRAAKRAVVDGLRLPFEEGLRLEGRLFVELQTGTEARDLEHRASARYEQAGDDERVDLGPLE
jgi:enoyl-CoA hydratase/carnithine racemase